MEYEAAKQYANDNFFFIYPESYTMGNILDKARSLVRKKGIKALVIDPYNRVESEQDYRQSETQHISKVLDQLTNFAQQNDVLVFLMAHPTKMPKNPDGKFQVPTLYDISGSANFYNKADFGISVHRDKEFGWTEIHVQKVNYRHLGQGGMAKFKYNLFNSRYVPYEDNVPPNWDNSNYLAAKANSATMSSIFEPNTEFDDLPF
jgi:twinkle protein